MKIVITGGAGLLGQYLNIKLSPHHSILTLYHKNLRNCNDFNSAKADINDFDEMRNIFTAFCPDAVVHTASVSSPVTAGQSDIEYVRRTNIEATANLAELCALNNALMVYTSTDLVYAGDRGSMLYEDAALDPVSLYSETKLKAEEKIKAAFDNYIILRTALLYGAGLNNTYNHFHQVYLNLKNGIPVKLFTDQFRTPLELEDAADIIASLLSKDVRGEIINFGGRERISRFRLGELLCGIAGFDKRLLQPSLMSDIPDLPAVKDVSMDTSKLQSYGIQQKSIEESIKELVRKL